ncbi:MAG: hypothetical protein JNL70_26110 [Saprospiraceae bacterium]|nr:hypothetical protein [Saprospiraceae bacterium]
MKKNLFTNLCLLIAFTLVSFIEIKAQVTFTIRLEADGITYKVWMKSTTAYTQPLAQIPTTQVTVLVPHGAGANAFVVQNFINYNASMQFGAFPSRVNAPTEAPTIDYLSFGFTGATSFNIAANTEIPLFSFQNAGPCLGSLSLITNATDPFNQLPNSANSNPGNAITILGKGGDAYSGNYGTPANACNAPVANPDNTTATVGVTKNIAILSNDVNPDGTPVTDLTKISLPTIVTPPTKGTATVKPDGTVDYVANTGATGTDTFNYQICNKNAPLVCSTTTVTITILASPCPNPNCGTATIVKN